MNPCSLAALALALAAGPTSLEGGGVRVTVDLRGFELDLPAARLHDASYRLGQFSLRGSSPRARGLGRSLVLSVLADEVPAGTDLTRLRARVVAERDPKPKVTELSSPPGFWFTTTTLMPKNLEQWHFSFHTVAGERWVELHFSSVGLAGGDTTAVERLALEIVRSLRVALPE